MEGAPQLAQPLFNKYLLNVYSAEALRRLCGHSRDTASHGPCTPGRNGEQETRWAVGIKLSCSPVRWRRAGCSGEATGSEIKTPCPALMVRRAEERAADEQLTGAVVGKGSGLCAGDPPGA